MTTERELKKFWESEIKHRLPPKALGQKVTLIDGRKVRNCYLDNAATTKPFSAVKKAVDAYLDMGESIHRGAGSLSTLSTEIFETARERIARFAHAPENAYVIITSNTTGAMNQAAALWKKYLGERTQGGEILISDVEHSSSSLPYLQHHHNIICFRTVDSQFDIRHIREILQSRGGSIKLISITGASNVTGYKPPIHEIAELAHEHGAQILVDACQYIQHNRVDMKPTRGKGGGGKNNLDFIAFSGHKIYAPYGAGILIGPKDFFDTVGPYQIGGGNLSYITPDWRIKKLDRVQAHDPGTPNAVGVIAIAVAMDELNHIGMDNVAAYEHGLMELACDGLSGIESVVRSNIIHPYVI